MLGASLVVLGRYDIFFCVFCLVDAFHRYAGVSSERTDGKSYQAYEDLR